MGRKFDFSAHDCFDWRKEFRERDSESEIIT